MSYSLRGPGVLLLGILISQSPTRTGDLRASLTEHGAIQPPAQWTPYQVETDAGPVDGQLGRIRVSERRGAAASRQITLAFARIPSTSSNPGPPVVYLDGGPGGSGIGAARVPNFGALFRELRAHADVILVSQRGAGLSDRISCRLSTPLADDALVSMTAFFAHFTRRAADCASMLRDDGVDLSGYNTEESADDIEAVRAALGVPRIALVGFSYGTHLALSVIRRHGDRVSRAVLLGIEGPDDTWKLPSSYDRQIAAVQLMIKADAKARSAMPHLGATLETLLTRLEKAPAQVDVTIGGVTRRFSVGPAGLLYLLRLDIGDSNDLPWIPAFVYETAAGDYRQLSRLLARRLPALEGGLQMTGIAVDCASAASKERLGRIRREEPASIFGRMTNYPFPDACAAARLDPLPESFRSSISSTVPALLVSGTLDSNTPPAQAESVMRGLARSSHLVVQGAGHESTLVPEVRARVVRFLRGEAVQSEHVAGSALTVELPETPARR